MKPPLLVTLGLILYFTQPNAALNPISQPTNTTIYHGTKSSKESQKISIDDSTTTVVNDGDNEHGNDTDIGSNDKDGIALPEKGGHGSDVVEMERNDVIVIDLEEINKMSVLDYLGRTVKAYWNKSISNGNDRFEDSFVGRCIGVAKTIKRIAPFMMLGLGAIVTKLGFLTLFSLKTMGLVLALLLLNVATVAGKIGAHFASKKQDHSPQNIHFHVQPSKDEDHYVSHGSYHGGGSPYGWEDKSDVNLEGHELYNLYEKLKREIELRKYVSSIGR